jgi:hypothetical protein
MVSLPPRLVLRTGHRNQSLNGTLRQISMIIHRTEARREEVSVIPLQLSPRAVQACRDQILVREHQRSEDQDLKHPLYGSHQQAGLKLCLITTSRCLMHRCRVIKRFKTLVRHICGRKVAEVFRVVSSLSC